MRSMRAQKRGEKRAEVDLPVQVRFLAVPGEDEVFRRYIPCRTSDISSRRTRLTLVTTELQQGTRLGHVLQRDIPAGTVVRLRVRFPGRFKRVEIEGVVRWANRNPGTWVFVMGLELASPDAKSLQRWLRYVEAYCPEAAAD